MSPVPRRHVHRRCVVYTGWPPYSERHVQMLESSVASLRDYSSHTLLFLLYNFGAMSKAISSRINSSRVRVVQLPSFPEALDQLMGISGAGALFQRYPYPSKMLSVHHAARICQEVVMLDYDTLTLRPAADLWVAFPDVDILAVAEPGGEQFEMQWRTWAQEWQRKRWESPAAAQIAKGVARAGKRVADEARQDSEYLVEQKVALLREKTCDSLGASSGKPAVTLQNSIMRFRFEALRYFADKDNLRRYYHTMVKIIAGIIGQVRQMEYEGFNNEAASAALALLHSMQWRPELKVLNHSGKLYPYPVSNVYIVDAVSMWAFFACAGLNVKLFPISMAHNQKLQPWSCAAAPIILHTHWAGWELGRRIQQQCDNREVMLTIESRSQTQLAYISAREPHGDEVVLGAIKPRTWMSFASPPGHVWLIRSGPGPSAELLMDLVMPDESVTLVIKPQKNTD